jgi:hypothetical protein
MKAFTSIILTVKDDKIDQRSFRMFVEVKVEKAAGV